MNHVKGRIFSPLSIGEVEPLQNGENPPLQWDGAKTHTGGEIKAVSVESEIEREKPKWAEDRVEVEHI